MIRPIRRYGDSVLHQPAQPVGEITPEIEELVRDMVETLYAAPGVGLAAPQVGVPLRLFVDRRVGRSQLAGPDHAASTPSSSSATGCSSRRKDA